MQAAPAEDLTELKKPSHSLLLVDIIDLPYAGPMCLGGEQLHCKQAEAPN